MIPLLFYLHFKLKKWSQHLKIALVFTTVRFPLGLATRLPHSLTTPHLPPHSLLNRSPHLSFAAPRLKVPFHPTIYYMQQLCTCHSLATCRLITLLPICSARLLFASIEINVLLFINTRVPNFDLRSSNMKPPTLLRASYHWRILWLHGSEKLKCLWYAHLSRALFPTWSSASAPNWLCASLCSNFDLGSVSPELYTALPV